VRKIPLVPLPRPAYSGDMERAAFILLICCALRPMAAGEIDLLSPARLQLINVKARPATFKGRKSIQIVDAATPGTSDAGRLAIIRGSAFRNGTIEIQMAGEPMEGANPAARGFVGIAFRVTPDARKFECIYLRPTNGRADDQERRNHSVQYISAPDWPWFRLRKEFPGKYETYVDLQPAVWIPVRLDVRGDKLRLYVHGAEQPTLIVNDLKLGESGGAIALWVGTGTRAWFTGLRVNLEP
jgi:hypothetical protein